MGVTGLWQLLESAGRPVRLETLEGKVLAVDVSIWLHQALKGMRDRDGNPVQNAHLISLFNKVCKLLFYRIKPVFVFDGGVPALKKKTLAGRKERKEQAEKESQKTAKKMISNYLKSYAMQQLTGEKQPAVSLPSTSRTELDIYELPPLPIRKEAESSDTDSSEEELYQSHLQNMDDIDIDSADFKLLPSELQHEILFEMKERRKRNFWATISELPEDSDDFSEYQMKKLLKQSKLSTRIEDVRKEMNNQQAMEITGGLAENYYGSCDIESRRVVSDDTSHYVLIKGLAKRKKQLQLAQKKEEERLNDLRKYFEEIQDESKEKPSTITHTEDEKHNGKDVKEPIPSTSGFQEKPPESDYKKAVVVVDGFDGDDDDSETDNKAPANPEQVLNWVKATQGQINSQTVKPRKTVHKTAETELIEVDSDDEVAVVNMGTNQNSSDISESKFKDTEKNVEGQDMHAAAVITSVNNSGKTSFDDCEESKTIDIEHKNISLDSNVTPTENSVGKEQNNSGFAEDKLSFSNDSTSNTVLEQIPVKPASQEEKKRDNLISGNFKTAKSDSAEPLPNDSAKHLPEVNLVSEVGEAEELQPRERTTAETSAVSSEEGQSDDEEDDFIEIPELSSGVRFSRSISEVNGYEGETSEVTALENRENDIEMEPDNKTAENFRAQLVDLTEEGLRDLQSELQEEAVTLQSQHGKQARLAVSIGDQIYTEAQELLGLFGLPYLVSPLEAEAQCAYLDATGQTHGTITDDSDVWLFGGKRVYKNFFNKGKLVEFFKIEDCVSQFGLDRDKFISIALLCGSDYTHGIQGVGPVTAMEIMAEFPGEKQDGLKAFKKWWRKAHRKPVQMSDTKLQTKLRQISLLGGFPDQAVVDAYLNPEVDTSKEKFTWGTPELDSLRDFAREKLGWQLGKTDEILLPVMKQLNKPSTQGRITSFFTTEIHQPVKKPQSKRMKKTIEKILDSGVSSSAQTESTRKQAQMPAKKSTTKKIVKEVCLSESSSSESDSEDDSAGSKSENEADLAAMFEDEFEDEFFEDNKVSAQQTAKKLKEKSTQKKTIPCASGTKGKGNQKGKSQTVSKPAKSTSVKPKSGKPVFSKRARSSHMPL